MPEAYMLTLQTGNQAGTRRRARRSRTSARSTSCSARRFDALQRYGVGRGVVWVLEMVSGCTETPPCPFWAHLVLHRQILGRLRMRLPRDAAPPLEVVMRSIVKLASSMVNPLFEIGVRDRRFEFGPARVGPHR